MKGLLFQSIPEDLVLQIGNLKTGKEMWEAIKIRNLGANRVKEARLQTLITEFENLRMSDNDSIDAYSAKLSGIASKSATLGEVMSEHKLVKKFLTSLPRCFVHIVAALEQVLDFKTTRFEDVVGRLKAIEYSNGNNDLSRGRGRGSYSRGRGRGRGQGRGRDNSQNQGQRDSSKNREENKQKETLFMNEEKYTPPKSESNTDENEVWYFDNGASNHMTAGKGWKIHHMEVKMAFINDDLFVAGASLDLINEFKRRMASQFEMSDPNELTYYLDIKVSQGKVALRSKDELEVEATQYRKMVSCLRYLLHTRPDLTYSVYVVSRYMQSPRESHARAMKQILRYLRGTTSFRIKYKRGNDMRLAGYSSHNFYIDDGRSTTRHVFNLATSAACQAIWLRELLAKVTRLERQKVIIRVDNKSSIALSKNPVFHGRSKHVHTRYHFIRECVKNEQGVIVEEFMIVLDMAQAYSKCYQEKTS
uniref:Zinc finger, CCHC-type n=1 Tax=Tanacetum cinerariifolium TaxID=118510 RepID=A0A6L2LTZ9_TANCI|nr:hypothetical protein [Tanacetum cinerariifolium]